MRARDQHREESRAHHNAQARVYNAVRRVRSASRSLRVVFSSVCFRLVRSVPSHCVRRACVHFQLLVTIRARGWAAVGEDMNLHRRRRRRARARCTYAQLNADDVVVVVAGRTELSWHSAYHSAGSATRRGRLLHILSLHERVRPRA